MIAFFSIAPFISGSERCLQLMLLEASNCGWNPVVVTSPNSPMEKWAKDNLIVHYSTELNPVKFRSRCQWFIEQIKLTVFLKRHNVRVIHSNQIWSYRATILPAKLLRAKIVCHFRDPIDSGSKWWLPKKPDLCIFISQFIEMQYVSWFSVCSEQNFLRIIDPINRPRLSSYGKAEQRKIEAREFLGLDQANLVLGFIGQIAPVKGLLETIDILSALDRDDWMLLVAGEDPSFDRSYLKRCIRVVQDKGISHKVKFVGFQDDVSLVYEAIDLVIMLSKEEPLGLIPLEAAGFFRPSIVSKVGGLPETVNHGKSGWIIDPQDRKKAIITIQSITLEKLQNKGINARRFIESINDPNEYWQRLTDAYSKAGVEITKD